MLQPWKITAFSLGDKVALSKLRCFYCVTANLVKQDLGFPRKWQVQAVKLSISIAAFPYILFLCQKCSCSVDFMHGHNNKQGSLIKYACDQQGQPQSVGRQWAVSGNIQRTLNIKCNQKRNSPAWLLTIGLRIYISFYISCISLLFVSLPAFQVL